MSARPNASKPSIVKLVGVGIVVERRGIALCRNLATVPLYAVSYDGTSRSDKADAWATPTVVSAAVSLRQWRDGAVTFRP